MIKGSCLCGQVKYEISGKLSSVGHCHCITCRKAHGSAFSSVAAVNDNDIKFSVDKNMLKFYESSPGKKRYFCSNCGSQIYAKRDNQSHYILRLGTLDNDPLVRPEYHIWLEQKAPWYEIKTDHKLPMFRTWQDYS